VWRLGNARGLTACLRAATSIKCTRYFDPSPRPASLREAGFRIEHGRIVDASGKCPGFAALPIFRDGPVNRDATLSKVLGEREAETARRAGTT
jgi:hypothetical protein